MKFTAISEDDKNFIEIAMDMAEEIVYHYKKDWEGAEISPEVLDQVFAQWLDNPSEYGNNQVINSLGVALGEYMRRHLQMHWTIVTDQYGTVMAVHREQPDWTTFPFDTVSKRVQSREGNFFAAIYKMSESEINK